MHNLTRDESAERARLLTVDSYVVGLDLTLGAELFGSRTEVRFTCSEPGAATFIELGAAEIGSAVLNGRPVDVSDYSPEAGLRLPGLAADNLLVVDATCRYSRDGQGLHRLVDPVDGEAYLYTHFESNGAQLMYACFDQPDLKATFALTVTMPAHWRAIGNMSGVSDVAADDTRTVAFAVSPRMSTYITSLCAGPYHEVRDTHDGIDLGLYCRRSMAGHLESEELFALTKAGLDHFNTNFGVRYPLGKYDQVAAAEYNSGATEHFGAVTFAEEYFVFRSQVTDAEREFRAYVMYHEMAHMWFGDLVTMAWWDELWLKESFATWAGYWATAEATRFGQAWTTFQVGGKNSATRQDQLSTTHPIRAEIPDVAAGRANYDAITYSKGAGVLKQLVAYVGLEGFLAGLHEYFEKHQWDVAGFADLREALETASGRDLGEWSARWLETVEVNTLTADFTLADGDYATFAVVQTAPEEGPTLRTHRMAVGLYDLADGVLTRRRRIELDVSGERTEVPELVGERQPDVLLLNDDDLTYAKTHLDERTLATVSAHMNAFTESLPRALCWSTAWNMLRDGTMPAADFLRLVATCLPGESHAGILSIMRRFTDFALHWYTPEGERAAARELVAAASLGAIGTVPAGGGAQLTWLKSYAANAHGEADVARMRGWLEGVDVPEGLTLDAGVRWTLLSGLAASGAIDSAAIDAEVARDDTTSGRDSAVTARATLPDAVDKAVAWAAIAPLDAPTRLQRATLAGFWRGGEPEVLRPYVLRMLDLIGELAAAGQLERASELGHTTPFLPAEAATVEAIDAWLAEPGRPAHLRRLVTEGRDELSRAIRVQHP
ncbi:aminopeptidase N [Phytomonospora endophytica]|uniref:aminopeptidase N n=1 Tax=Phytomonospora endophytica TaxID=714109 RepID=UPI0016077744|nr:aminopeptidase N [Phytomonospora endophytica]